MIPWSAEREHQLRRRILVWRGYSVMALAFAITCGIFAMIDHEPLLIFSFLLCFVAFFLSLQRLSSAVAQLGYEETVTPRGSRWPGSGMLQNKPRDTSRLTKWRQWKESEGLGPLGFTCEQCFRPHHWADMQWIPNVSEVEPEILDAPEEGDPVDPGGGRYVLICQCGMGHFRLRDSNYGGPTV